MTLDDLISAKTQELFASADAPLALACVVRAGGDPARAFDAYLTVGEAPVEVTQAHGQADRRRKAQALGFLPALSQGLDQVTGQARPPRHGDEVVIATGGLAGRWVVDQAPTAGAGGVQLALVCAERQAVAGPGVRA